MSTSKKFYYIVYKTTNLVNQHFYVGAHRTLNINDRYLGSGKLIRRAINEFGLENFQREIIKICDTHEEAYELEALIVDSDFLLRDDVYNMKCGGGSVTDYFDLESTRAEQSRSGKVGGQRALDLKKGIHSLTKEQHSKNGKKGAASCKARCSGIFAPENKGVGTAAALSESSRKKRIESFKRIEHQQGSKNNQYGTMWIKSNAMQCNCKIPGDLEIPKGWSKGRNMSYNTISVNDISKD